MPVLSVAVSIGLVLIGFAFNRSRMELGGAEHLFWIGLLVMAAPAIIRLFSQSASRRERIGILLVFALGLYLVKVLYSPLLFTFGDELQHWRTALDILKTDRLFSLNPILTVSPYYPGLEIITHAVVSLSGLSIFQAGLLIIGLAWIVLILAIFLFYERASGSPRIAGIASLIYMAHPHFAFFDAQYAYESLAISFATLALYAAASRIRWESFPALGLTLVSFIAILATVITHHVTSYFLSAFLALAALVSFTRYRWRKVNYALDGLALFSIVASLTWLAYVATQAVQYLTPTLQVIGEVLHFLEGEAPTRQFFQTGSGEPAPLWLQIPSYASVILILFWLPFGLRRIWREYTDEVLALVLAIIAILYPLLQFLRLTPNIGQTVLQRSMPFVFLGIGFVLALGLAIVPRSHRIARVWRFFSILSVLLIFAGSIASNLNSWQLPGPVRLGVYTQSVGFQSVEAVEWARDKLHPGNRFGSDEWNQLVLGSYGEQRVVTDQADRIWLDTVLYSPEFNVDEQSTLARGDIHYLLVDLRRLEQFSDETNLNLDPGHGLTKFDHLEGVSRIFDSEDIRIYDVGVLAK